MRSQVSIDFLIALTLVTITALNLISLGLTQMEEAKSFDLSSKVKVFAIDVRDTVTKVYSCGEGFAVKKTWPFELNPGDEIIVSLETSGIVNVTLITGGKRYTVIERLQVPIAENSSVILTTEKRNFWIKFEGGVKVE
ncbi:hypothetical protein [Pyrococcus horikoshii]|nr:hypothetical protein [Pyrococcus horikoshii]HII60342.1 hypothetical protein [Pyrococcus horikoshii]